MKKIFLTILGLLLFFMSTFIYTEKSYAKVYFIDKKDAIGDTMTRKPCQLQGYTYTAKTCQSQGKHLSNLCPADSSYGRSCSCDTAVFKYNNTNCTDNRTLTGDSCDGKYEGCGCNSTVYKWNNSSCTSPKELTGKMCNKTVEGGPNYGVSGKLYDTCACPSGYTTCSGDQVGVGTACQENSVNKYSSCQCTSSFMKCNNGGDTGAKSCTDSEGIKYSSCKKFTCADGGYVAASPTGQKCTTQVYEELTCYKDCKAKTCADGGYVAAIPSGQTCTTQVYEGLTCYKDCKAKTCADGGYVAAIPSGQTCTTQVYEGLTCYKNCSVSVCSWSEIIDYGANSKCKKWNCAGGDPEGQLAASVNACKTKCTASTQPNYQCSPCCIMADDGFSNMIDMCQ
ncbi:MAG: hypothetical protein ACK5N8_07925 [Alphaproteobacteria bacterium]